LDDIWRCINYNHINPIKHGYVDSLLNLSSYKWSSYNQYLEKFGIEFMMECFEKYPINFGMDEKWNSWYNGDKAISANKMALIAREYLFFILILCWKLKSNKAT